MDRHVEQMSVQGRATVSVLDDDVLAVALQLLREQVSLLALLCPGPCGSAGTTRRQPTVRAQGRGRRVRTAERSSPPPARSAPSRQSWLCTESTTASPRAPRWIA